MREFKTRTTKNAQGGWEVHIEDLVISGNSEKCSPIGIHIVDGNGLPQLMADRRIAGLGLTVEEWDELVARVALARIESRKATGKDWCIWKDKAGIGHHLSLATAGAPYAGAMLVDRFTLTEVEARIRYSQLVGP